MYKYPPTASMLAGGSRIASWDTVEYQIVDPRWPEENGRSCLNGTRETTVEELEDVPFACATGGPRD